MKINFCYILLVFNCCFSQINLLNRDTINSKYYNCKDKIIKSFEYKKQYVTTQTGEKLFVFFDSICDKSKQRQKQIFAQTIHDKYFYYRDSLIVRNWDFKNTPIANDNYFNLTVYLKSKKYKNIAVSFDYNRKDSLIRRIVVKKPDPLTFYTKEIYIDSQFKDTKLKNYQSYRINDNETLHLYFNEKNFIEKLYYEIDSSKTLYVEFSGFYIPREYGYCDPTTQNRFGIWYEYDQKGHLLSEGEYSRNEYYIKTKEVNLKTGKWIYYTSEGCIGNEEKWVDGKLVNKKN